MGNTLTAAEAAQFLGLSEDYLCNMRGLGDGPPFIKKPGQRPSVFYERDVLVAYRDAREAGLDPRSAREVTITLTEPFAPPQSPEDEQTVSWTRPDGLKLTGPWCQIRAEIARSAP